VAVAVIIATLHFVAVLECAAMIFEYDIVTIPLRILLFPHWLLLKSQLTWPFLLLVSSIWGVIIGFVADWLIGRWKKLRIIGIVALVCIVLAMAGVYTVGSIVAIHRNRPFVH
jgi:hypothetical protein